jgi:NADPH:quinone reductase-like Zn-dependent oxidoreductase
MNHYKNSLPAEYGSQIKLIATCSAKNFDYVKSLGATHCIDYNNQNIETEVKTITNGVGADVWVDLVSAQSA